MAPKGVWLEPPLLSSSIHYFHITNLHKSLPLRKSLSVCLDFMSPSKVKQSVLTM